MNGNKAKNLQILTDLNLNVPKFYVINSTLLKRLDEPAIVKKLTDKYVSWCRDQNCQSVAVRSSADGEDSVSKSFAGQFTSVMEVEGGDNFIKALRQVANSKPFAGYSSNEDVSINAIVQIYIKPDLAGVMFTINPANGSPEVLINVATGHGSKVVDGEDVSSIHVNRSSGDIYPKVKYTNTLLTKSQIEELSKYAKQIEKEFGNPQDIEWAFADNTFYFLQTRPITIVNHLRVWDNANLGESFPGIVLPLTFSISRRGYELVYKSQGYAAGLNWYQLEENQRTFNAMVGIFGGRMYYNLGSWYKFIGLFPNNSQNQKYLDEQLQTIGDAAYLPPNSYPLSYKIKFYFRIIRRTVLFGVEKRKYWRKLKSVYTNYEDLPSGNDLFTLMDRYAFIEQRVIPIMGRSADNDFFVMIYHGVLKSRLKKWLDHSDVSSLNFLGSLHNVISARQAILLSDIANFVKNDKTAYAYLKNNKYQELDDYLLESKAKHLLIEYRTDFLHRFAEDQKIEVINPMLKLSNFYELIYSYTKLDNKAISERRSKALINEARRNEQILEKLKPTQRIIYRILIHRLKSHLRIREQNRLLRGKAYAYLRELFIEVGTSLQQNSLIEATNDVYYLEIEEIFRLIDGTGFEDNLTQIINSRKQKYNKYRKLKAPSRFITTGLTDQLPKDFFKPSQSVSGHELSFKGTISSPGTIEGIVVVLEQPIIPKEPFDILVVSHTDPGWTPLIALAKGLIVEHGGILSHAAIVTRELGIPSIIGVEDITERLKNGMRVRINTSKQTVDILSHD